MVKLRNAWSNKILHLSSYITRVKNELVFLHGWRALVSVVSVIGAEIMLLIISLPSYLATRDIGNESEEQTKQYKLRRALTLGTLMALLVIWVIKLLLIFFLIWHTNTYGTVKISETNNQEATLETAAHDMLVANVDKDIPPPDITFVTSGHGKVTLTGGAKAGNAVIVLFSETGERKDLPPKIYTAWADENEKFVLVEDSSIFNLPPGEYSVSAITYDQVHKTKSADSTSFDITVKQSLVSQLVHNFDAFLNILALIAIIVGILITILVS